MTLWFAQAPGIDAAASGIFTQRSSLENKPVWILSTTSRTKPIWILKNLPPYRCISVDEEGWPFLILYHIRDSQKKTKSLEYNTESKKQTEFYYRQFLSCLWMALLRRMQSSFFGRSSNIRNRQIKFRIVRGRVSYCYFVTGDKESWILLHQCPFTHEPSHLRSSAAELQVLVSLPWYYWLEPIPKKDLYGSMIYFLYHLGKLYFPWEVQF